MQDRLGFVDAFVRKQFFEAFRSALNSKNWRELASSFGLHRTLFQKYQYGQLLLPEELFEKMLFSLPAERQDFFTGKFFRKAGNWGAIRGGRVLFEKYPEEFKKRRENGLKKLKELGNAGGKIKFKIDENIPLSEEFCEFVGAFIGDGWLDYSNSSVGIVGNRSLDSEYLIRLKNNAQSVFGLNGKLSERKDCLATVLRLNSKMLCELFVNRFGFPKGAKTHSVRIPEEILNSEEQFIFAVIRGIFDTDGCVFLDKRKIYKKPYPRISLQIVSKNLAEQLFMILSKEFIVYKGFNASRHSQYIEIYGIEQLQKWMRLIGFSNERNLRKVREACGET
ncbi:MAG: LAGLIDADG family homing endonuclease [Candidatus Diapherotrites archaeon]|nr:LAGLIDADG family homing endonuclease [Candidatus Diapherotrites archaeon]